jgi:hypothetical protein
MTLEQYAEWLRTRQIKWKGALYSDHVCEQPEACKVSMIIAIETTLRGISTPQQSNGVADENWLRIEGVWYHLPKETR